MLSGMEEAAIERGNWTARQLGTSYSSDIIGGAMEADEYGRNYPSNFRFIEGGPSAAGVGREVSAYPVSFHSFSDEINTKVKALKELDKKIAANYDETSWWHDVKDIFGWAKPLVPDSLIAQRSGLLNAISENYSYLKISNKSPMEQALAGHEFATLPQGVPYNLGNLGNIMGQLSGTLANPELTQNEQNALRSAYVNVMARGNSEGVLHAEVDKQLFLYAVNAPYTSGSLKTSVRPVMSEINGINRPGRFVAYQAPAQPNYAQKSHRSYGNVTYNDARGNPLAQGLPNTKNLSQSGSRVDANGRVVPNGADNGANRIPSPGDVDFMGPVIKVGEGSKVYIPATPLPMKTVPGVGDVPLPLTEANGLPHSVLGGKVASDGVTVYRQSATFEVGTWPKPNGLDIPWGRVDWTDHPYLPGPAHPNPHIHEFYYDFKQGQWRTTAAKPYYGN
jgi:hypothetical protein